MNGVVSLDPGMNAEWLDALAGQIVNSGSGGWYDIRTMTIEVASRPDGHSRVIITKHTLVRCEHCHIIQELGEGTCKGCGAPLPAKDINDY